MELADEVSASPDASAETRLSALVTAARAHRAAGASSDAKQRYASAAELARGSSASRRRQVLAEYAEFASSTGDDKLALDLYRDALAG